LDHVGLEGRRILLSHHILVYLLSGLFPVRILGSIITTTWIKEVSRIATMTR
jgi:hypothetical protein